MKAKTFSILAGSEACNARCPFCVSKMTPSNGLNLNEPQVNWRNFSISAKVAKQAQVDTVMITGKGEPTLFPDQISKYMQNLKRFDFPFIELQTNGIPLAEKKDKYLPYLRQWYEDGLTSVAISVVHYDPEKNRQIYLPQREKYIDLSKLISNLHDIGISVRLSTVLVDGYIDKASELEKMINFSKTNKVEQLTLRPVNKPSDSRNSEVYDWTSSHHLKQEQLNEIQKYLESKGKVLMNFPHGGIVYDIDDQNVCLTNSLTHDSDPDNIRQLIFFPDGHLRYSWEYKGALLL